MLPSYKTSDGCFSLLITNTFCSKSASYSTWTLNVNVCGVGVNVPVPSNTIPSPSSKSCSSSRRIPTGILSSVPCSNSIPWLLFAPSVSCSTLTEFLKLVLRTCVELSNPVIVPVWLVKVAPAAKVPLISLRTKCAVGSNSGGSILLYRKPPSVISNDSIEPISVVVAISFAPVPDVVSVTATVGSFV